MKHLIILSIAVALLLASCSRENPASPVTQNHDSASLELRMIDTSGIVKAGGMVDFDLPPYSVVSVDVYFCSSDTMLIQVERCAYNFKENYCITNMGIGERYRIVILYKK